MSPQRQILEDISSCRGTCPIQYTWPEGRNVLQVPHLAAVESTHAGRLEGCRNCPARWSCGEVAEGPRASSGLRRPLGGRARDQEQEQDLRCRARPRGCCPAPP
ncbi:unnamed protein product [Prorocentrum cordatum]|uniref:Uncharacterized protein n=1 Tax=Prorocentrum cordatum TaxID=2364126 RepID=A0ABN9VEN8_9DINO|nr:unnamed protein product [Polarella glacialis]